MCCIDDRISEGQFRLAGSGILLAEKIWFFSLVNMIKKSGVKEITSHEDCAEAKLYARIKSFDEWDTDKYGIEFAQ